ncbi:MAG: LytR family transcriptional regulator [Microgenomates group bacterium Gr01-1014_93]|nr:MAG: LytR family transcriptional regulator [Microgenomates group bacterium Gr01-1014_93]
MDGEVSLKFVRSRHGTNEEGSDFARSKRQQKVIEAFRKKVLSLETLGSPKKIGGLVEAFGQSFETDMDINEMIEIYALSKKVKSSLNFVLDTSKKLLTVPSYSEFGGAFVLIPPDRNYNAIHEYIKQVLNGEVKDAATSSARPGN